jgi:hypothetical protein
VEEEGISMAKFAIMLNTSRSRIHQLKERGLPVRGGIISITEALRWVAGNIGGASAKAKGGRGLAERAADLLRERETKPNGGGDSRRAFAHELCSRARREWPTLVAQSHSWNQLPEDQRVIERQAFLMEMLGLLEGALLGRYISVDQLPAFDWSMFNDPEPYPIDKALEQKAWDAYYGVLLHASAK